jgi:benzoyl-CoA reductase subunit C
MTPDAVLKQMKAVVLDPVAAAKRFKEAYRRPVFGYFCTYTPEEIIHAAGGIPFRIIGQKKKIRLADAHLQAYCCSLVRDALEDALGGRLEFLDGVVFPHTCDSIQRLSDIWRINAGFPFHADIVLPVKLHTESAKEYLIEELAQFVKKLSAYTKKEITDASLTEAIDLYNVMRNNLARLYEVKKNNPGVIPSCALNDCVQAAMFMPVEEHNRLMGDLLAAPPATGPDGKPSRILVVGNLCVFDEIYDFIDGSGGTVVGDDMCTGSRYFAAPIKKDGRDPVEAIADRIIERPICAAKHNPRFDRAAYLKGMIKDTKADGVIFLLIKFCDPHSFDYPYLMEAADEMKVPHLLLETEMDNPSLGQVKTRIDAFMEMIGGGHA